MSSKFSSNPSPSTYTWIDDYAITNGKGFFRMESPDGSTVGYSRNGQFTVDSDGYVINPNGMRLTGYGVAANGTLYAENALGYNATEGAYVNSNGWWDIFAPWLANNETLRIRLDSDVYPDGVDNPSVTLNVGAAGDVVYTVYDTAGNVIGGPTTAAVGTGAQTLNLSAFTDVGRVDIQATTAEVRVGGITWPDTSVFNVDLTSATNVANGGLTLEGLTSTNGPAHQIVTTSFAANPVPNITLSGFGSNGAAFTEAALRYGNGGVAINSAGGGDDGTRLDANPTDGRPGKRHPTIGDNVIIGAGAFVNKSIPANHLYITRSVGEMKAYDPQSMGRLQS